MRFARLKRQGAERSESLAILLAAILFFCALPAVAAAADVGIARSAVRSDAQVRDRWSELKPNYGGAPYASTPSVNSPYAPGSLNAGFLDDGLNTINFARFLVGIPHDVVLDSTKNADSQYGAVLLAASGFSHTPAKPTDMPQSFYDRGYASTSSSNIGWGDPDSESFQLGCLNDADSGNIDRVGHRRWLLNPRMLKTGIGFAKSRHTTYGSDSSRSAVEYGAVAYPSAGPFPMDAGFFGESAPWSITLNPARYDWDAAGHTVNLRRVSDGKTWTFTAADNDTSGEFFNFETSGYGVANCFIFRPNPSSIAYSAGDEFDVTLSGGIYLEGTRTPATVSYRTRFISLESVTIKPRARLGTPIAPKTMKRSKSYSVYGSPKPRHTKGTRPVRIYKYKKVGGTWKRIGYVRAKAYNYKGYTRYKVKMKLTKKGQWRLRAYAPADGKHAATWSSKYDHVTVK